MSSSAVIVASGSDSAEANNICRRVLPDRLIEELRGRDNDDEEGAPRVRLLLRCCCRGKVL